MSLRSGKLPSLGSEDEFFYHTGSLTSCAVRGRCCNERGLSDQNGLAGEPERTAPAGDARLFRTDRATGGERNPQLRAIPAGVGRTGGRGPAPEPHPAVPAP